MMTRLLERIAHWLEDSDWLRDLKRQETQANEQTLNITTRLRSESPIESDIFPTIRRRKHGGQRT